MRATGNIQRSVGSALTEAARKSGSVIVLDRQTIGTRDDVLIAHTVLQGMERLTLEDLAKGQDVFVRYYRLEPPSLMMPTGFAVVRILRNPAGQWRAELRNLQGRLIRELPAMVEQQTGVGRVTLTVGISDDGIHYGVDTPGGLRIALRYPETQGHTRGTPVPTMGPLG